jgi:hypothetical protein
MDYAKRHTLTQLNHYVTHCFDLAHLARHAAHNKITEAREFARHSAEAWEPWERYKL